MALLVCFEARLIFFPYLHIPSGRLSVDALQQLRASPDVEAIAEDGIVQAWESFGFKKIQCVLLHMVVA